MQTQLFSSFSVCSLPVYRNTVDFYIFVLYPATLLNSFISEFESFLFVYSLGFFKYKDTSLVNRDSFISSFAVWLLFLIYFPWLDPPVQCWIELARVDIDFLVPELRRKAVSVLLLVWRWLWVFCRCFLSGWGSSLLCLHNGVFLIIKRCWIFFLMLFVDQQINSLSRSFYTYTSSPFPGSPSLSRKHTDHVKAD